MSKTKQILLGAHMSIAGGLEKAILSGESIGCTAVQIFTKSNRQWASKELGAEEVELFKRTVEQSSIKKENIVVHASYLINIASPGSDTHKKSVAALIDELDRCRKLEIPFLVLHPGSNSNEAVALATIAQSLDLAFEAVPGSTMVLLETMAGQGSASCYTFEQIAQVYKLVNHKNRVGVCVDTCHIFAAGYDLRTEKAYHDTWEKFDKVIGLSLLKAIHCNDSKKELGSRVDRHADIGQGALGLTPFKLLFNDERFAFIPKILETPETTEILEDYKRNMETIKNLL